MNICNFTAVIVLKYRGILSLDCLALIGLAFVVKYVHSLLLFLNLDSALTGGQVTKSTVLDFIFDTDSCFIRDFQMNNVTL